MRSWGFILRSGPWKLAEFVSKLRLIFKFVTIKLEISWRHIFERLLNIIVNFSLRSSRRVAFLRKHPPYRKMLWQDTKLRFRNADEPQLPHWYIKFGTLRDKGPNLNICSEVLGISIQQFSEFDILKRFLILLLSPLNRLCNVIKEQCDASTSWGRNSTRMCAGRTMHMLLMLSAGWNLTYFLILPYSVYWVKVGSSSFPTLQTEIF